MQFTFILGLNKQFHDNFEIRISTNIVSNFVILIDASSLIQFVFPCYIFKSNGGESSSLSPYIATQISQSYYIHAISPGCVRREIIEFFGYFLVTGASKLFFLGGVKFF